jgi:hypothetical protein
MILFHTNLLSTNTVTLKMVILTSLKRPLQYFSACGMWNISSRNGNGCTSYIILKMHNVDRASNIYTAAGAASEAFKKVGKFPFMVGDNCIITKNLYPLNIRQTTALKYYKVRYFIFCMILSCASHMPHIQQPTPTSTNYSTQTITPHFPVSTVPAVSAPSHVDPSCAQINTSLQSLQWYLLKT